MMSVSHTKRMMWISLLLIGLVSTFIPPTAAAAATAVVQKGGIRSTEYGFVQRNRMLRADAKKQQQKEQEEIDLEVLVEEEVVQEEDVLPILDDVDELGLDTSRTTNSTEEANGGEDDEEELVEVVDLLDTSKDVTPIQLPSFSFVITADPDTDNIALSGLSSVLSEYLLEELQEKLPKSTLTSVDLDVNYEYKPEKSEVSEVGFAADEEDSVHIFTAQGTVFVNNSGIVVPTESKVFAKTRDSLSSEDAGEEIVTLLQESDEKSLQAAKTFSLSEVTSKETASLVNPSYSVPRTLDIFIGLTAVLVLLAGAYVARDKASSSEQPEDDEYDIEEVRTVKMKDPAEEEEETLPPTPPTTPHTTPSSPSDRKSSPQLIALSDFNIFDEFSHLGDDNNTATKEQTRESILKNSAVGDDSRGIAPFPTRAVSYEDGASTSASTKKSSSQLLSLSDFNILDEFMCHGGFAGEDTVTMTTDKSRHVTFKDDETDLLQTNSTSDETQKYETLLDGCGAIEMADGVKIDNSAMQTQKKQSRKEDKADADCGLMGVVDIGVEDLDICGNNDYDGETTYRDDTISYYSDDTDLTY